jgi:DNA-binding NarL/FixJ family response regulator
VTDSRTTTPVTIAVIDDHPIVLWGISRAVDRLPGVKITRVATSIDEVLHHQTDHPDVALLDLDLGDGTDPAENIRRLLKAGSAVVIFTATAHPSVVRAAMRAGASGYVPKTDDFDDLATAIHAAAQGTGWVSPQLAFVLLTDDAPDRPALTAREMEALRLYASGMPMRIVARRMGVAVETAKQYVDRVRVKYQHVGRAANTKVELYRRAVEDGILPG